jgi:hypothetical protein
MIDDCFISILVVVMGVGEWVVACQFAVNV